MPAENPNGAAGDDASNQRLHFVERLASVPLVAGVFDIVSQRCAAIKASSPLLSAALSASENVGAAAIGCCEHVLRVGLGPQLEHVDALACRGIEKLEQCCPVALRRPDEIAADVVAFGRQKVVQVQRGGLEQVERTRMVIVAAVHAATHPAAVMELVHDHVSQPVNRAFNNIDEVLDLWISAHDPAHDADRNNVAVSHTFSELVFTTLRKFSTAVTLQFACERAAFEEISCEAYERFQRFLYKTPSRSQPAQTPTDHAIAASQHALLAFLLAAQCVRRYYCSLLADVMKFYLACTETPKARRSPSASAASAFLQSQELPNDPCCSKD
ncbi:uncharacterized protein LOC125945176 [Dermacentor silvarum]|uniref:uncharacterized protein LOC125945176 n=1 Tax=Dermacentor silvarum TaxID=543639 RepID=UPI00210196E2|nr:uncharacterized protein LOC125945176 [Dermacentor silvarum]